MNTHPGTAEDLLEARHAGLRDFLRSRGSTMVLTVHDELVSKCRAGEANLQLRDRERMESVQPLAVPLIVDVPGQKLERGTLKFTFPRPIPCVRPQSSGARGAHAEKMATPPQPTFDRTSRYKEEASLHAAVQDLRERCRPSDGASRSHRGERLTRSSVDSQKEIHETVPRGEYVSGGTETRRRLAQGIRDGARRVTSSATRSILMRHRFSPAGIEMRVGPLRHASSVRSHRRRQDRRPWGAPRGEPLYTGLLRTLLGFRGTDTHGLKAVRRSRSRAVEACSGGEGTLREQLVIRGYRCRHRDRGDPGRVEGEAPAAINLFTRVQNV